MISRRFFLKSSLVGGAALALPGAAASLMQNGTWSALAEPLLESGRGDACVASWSQGVLLEFRPVVARVDVGGHVARVVLRAQDAAHELVETERLGASQLDDAIRAYRRIFDDLDRTNDGAIVALERIYGEKNAWTGSASDRSHVAVTSTSTL